MTSYVCFHCGDVFDAETFDRHLDGVIRSASPSLIKTWLYRLAEEW